MTLRQLYWWPMRRIDLLILWPACRREAAARGLGVEYAQAAFASHCFHDHAWTCLGEDELKRRIDVLQ